MCYGRGDKVPDGFVTVNTTSRSKQKWSRALSPFFLGPIAVPLAPVSAPVSTPVYIAEEVVCPCFENAWQYLKQYADQTDEEWVCWAREGMLQKKAVRFPRGRGAKPLHHVWKGHSLKYVEARRNIYAPLYAALVELHAAPALQRIQDMLDAGTDVALFDFDGHDSAAAGIPLEDVMYNTRRKMGHSFVLMGLLTDNRFWTKRLDRSRIFQRSVKRCKGEYTPFPTTRSPEKPSPRPRRGKRSRDS